MQRTINNIVGFFGVVVASVSVVDVYSRPGQDVPVQAAVHDAWSQPAPISVPGPEELTSPKSKDCDCDPCNCTVCFCGVIAQAPVVEVPPIDESAESPAVADWQQYVYPVRARGYDGRSQATAPECSAVSIGQGRFVTAAHLVHGLRSGYVVEVKVSGEWRAAQFRNVGNEDLALLTVAGVNVPGAQTRRPEYRESVDIFGLRSGMLQQGTILPATSLVSLETTAAGVRQGDSGGGVFGCDGSLVGIIRGHAPEDQRVVYFTGLENVESTMQSDTASAQRPPASAQRSPGVTYQGGAVCIGNQCYSPRGRFRWWK